MNESPDGTIMPTGQQPEAPVPAPVTGQQPGNRTMKIVAMVVAGVVVLAAAGIGGSVYMKKQKELKAPIKVGMLLPFSGPAGGAGLGISRGVKLAQKQLGASKVELIQEDSQCSGDTAKAAMKKLIAKGVVAVIGDACSGSSAAALEEAEKAGIVMIAPTASSSSLSKADNLFRVVPADDFQGKFAAKTMYDKGIMTAALVASDDSYSIGLGKVFKASFEELGGTVTESPFKEGDLDFSDQVADIKAANPGAIFLLDIAPPSGVAAIHQIRAAGITAPIYSGDAGDSYYGNPIEESERAAATGFTITRFPLGTQTFLQAMKNDFPAVGVNYGAGQGYDAFHAVFLAYQAGARTKEQVKAEISTTKFQGVTGPMEFDKNGEISSSAYKYELYQATADGVFVLVED